MITMSLLADIPAGELRGFGALGLQGATGFQASLVFTTFLTSLVGIMTVIGIIWFVIQFMIGAVGIIGAGGDKGKLTEARSKITSAITGIAVVISGIFFIDVVGYILGIGSILNITTYILCLSPVGAIPCP